MEVPQTIKQEKVDYFATETDVKFETNLCDLIEIKKEPIKVEPHSYVHEPNNLDQKFSLPEKAKMIGDNDICNFNCS